MPAHLRVSRWQSTAERRKWRPVTHKPPTASIRTPSSVLRLAPCSSGKLDPGVYRSRDASSSVSILPDIRFTVEANGGGFIGPSTGPTVAVTPPAFGEEGLALTCRHGRGDGDVSLSRMKSTPAPSVRRAMAIPTGSFETSTITISELLQREDEPEASECCEKKSLKGIPISAESSFR